MAAVTNKAASKQNAASLIETNLASATLFSLIEPELKKSFKTLRTNQKFYITTTSGTQTLTFEGFIPELYTLIKIDTSSGYLSSSRKDSKARADIKEKAAIIKDWAKEHDINLIYVHMDLKPGDKIYREYHKSQKLSLIEYHIEGQENMPPEAWHTLGGQSLTAEQKLSLTLVAYDISKIITGNPYATMSGICDIGGDTKYLNICEMYSEMYGVDPSETNISLPETLQSCQRQYIMEQQSIRFKKQIKAASSQSIVKTSNKTIMKARNINILRGIGLTESEIATLTGDTQQQISNFISNHKDLMNNQIQKNYDRYKDIRKKWNNLSKQEQKQIVQTAYLRWKRLTPLEISETLRTDRMTVNLTLMDKNYYFDIIQNLLVPTKGFEGLERIARSGVIKLKDMNGQIDSRIENNIDIPEILLSLPDIELIYEVVRKYIRTKPKTDSLNK